MPAHHHQVILNRDHARPRQVPAPAPAAVAARRRELVGPAAVAVQAGYRARGLRARILTLPVMVGAVLTLLWRQIPSVSELVRVLAREGVLLAPPATVSQQALSQRLRCLPARMFEAVLTDLLPTLMARAAARPRPQPAVFTRAGAHFSHVRAADGTTLEAVFKNVGLCRGEDATMPGGKLEALLDLATHLPVALWLDDDAAANDLRFQDAILGTLAAPTVLVADAQYVCYPFWNQLVAAGHAIVCRAHGPPGIQAVEAVLVDRPHVRGRLLRVGSPGHVCAHPVRLVEGSADRQRWHRVLCCAPDPLVFTTTDLIDLYAQRWRVEEAFLQTKRLLGLSYLWSGAFNTIALQVWATWILYAVLVGLTDAVAEVLDRPLADLSVEMVYRGLYHYAAAALAGPVTDPVIWLAVQPDLGIVKRPRPKRARQRAIREAWRTELIAAPPRSVP